MSLRFETPCPGSDTWVCPDPHAVLVPAQLPVGQSRQQHLSAHWQGQPVTKLGLLCPEHHMANHRPVSQQPSLTRRKHRAAALSLDTQYGPACRPGSEQSSVLFQNSSAGEHLYCVKESRRLLTKKCLYFKPLNTSTAQALTLYFGLITHVCELQDTLPSHCLLLRRQLSLCHSLFSLTSLKVT